MNDIYNDDYDELVPGAKVDRRRQILNQLQEIDMDDDFDSSCTEDSYTPTPSTSSFLPSSLKKSGRKRKEKENVPEQTDDEWFQDLMSSHDIKIKRAKRHDIFADAIEEATGGKKKKKKKKDKNEPTDYKKEFEREVALLNNILLDQTRFVDSLQKQYDFLNSNKSSSRGINKNMTDLIQNITSARQLAMNIIDKHTSLKKTIADLTMKEKKELSNSLGDMENLSDFASTYLKQMITERHQMINGTNPDISDYSVDEMASFITDELNSSPDGEERPEEVEKYLEYENMEVTIYVFMNTADETDYEYVAIDKDGNTISDYPLPLKGKLSVNRSTEIATDAYGQKYPIRWT